MNHGDVPTFDFRLDGRSGVPTYLQLVHQVKHAVRLGVLRSGDQLPTVREVVAELAINPNTVAKAYRELEHEGFVHGRPGLGTFVNDVLTGRYDPLEHAELRRELSRWVERARSAGLDDESIDALWAAAVRAEGIA